MILLVVLLRLPAVQTALGKRATAYLNDSYNTNIVVKKVDLSFLGNVKLKGIDIKDHQKDSLIYVKALTTSIFNYQDILNNKLELGEATIDGLILNMTTHKGEDNDNLSVFIDSFDDGTESSGNPFLMTSSSLNLTNARFTLKDRNDQEEPIVFYKNISGKVNDFKIEGPNVYANIRDLSFIDNHDIHVTELNTDFTYTKTQMNFKNANLKTALSNINGDIVFDYKREDLADFNNKVQITAAFDKSKVSLKDINKFYNEFGENINVNFTTKFEGVLNDFTLKDFNLISNRNSVIDGELHFKNVISRENGFSLDARIYELSSNYENLKRMLPNLLGKTLPSTLEKFGRFNLAGQSFITPDAIDADLMILSALGRTISDLKLTNIDDIDDAKYQGKVEFVDLNFGKIVNDSLIGNISLVADVNGQGFTLEKLNTKINGTITKHQYKGYTYSDITVNGVIKNQLFDGHLTTNDENLKMKFNGLADLSTKDYKFDFNADVAYSDFNKLNLFKGHEKAILKGKIDIKLTGNTPDNVAGVINFKDASYSNHVGDYFFKDFNVTSSFKDTTRTITVNSTDIVNGTLKGRYKFNELEKLAKNSLGSIYTNYKPEKVTDGQFLDFNFKIYNQIVEVFFPEVNLGVNTTIRGKINADNQKFELLVKSPKIEAYKNVLDNIRLQIDNKNPLYNTLLSLDKVDTKYYDVADLNLVNVTLNDTLFFRTEFFGGKKFDEKFDLSFYHTINENNKSVVGVKKSNIKFKNNEWLINPKDNNQNKVTIADNFSTYAFDKINAESGNQKIDFSGVMSGKQDKDLSVNLENVLLEGITPEIENFNLKGLVNGNVNYKQVKGEYLPTAYLLVDELKVNDVLQGDLSIDATGYNSLDKFVIAASLQNEKLKSIDFRGEVDLEPKQPEVFANFSLNDYDIAAYNALGEGVLDKIRGKVSGQGVITGVLENPDINGELYLKNGGIAIPYLNVDYDIMGDSKIEVSNQTLHFVGANMVDVAHDTEATLTGNIIHRNFKEWYLDLNLKTDNLLVLNTQEDEEIPYYGTGFLEGEADITGYTDRLVIDVIGKTMPGTEFIIPLSDISTVGDSKLVSFVNKMQKGENDNIVEDLVIDDLLGLSLNFELEVTDDARAEIVVDRNTGSVLSGKGNAYLDISINTNGRFDIFGTYVVSSGIYEFRNIVNKDFTVDPGGTVVWEGNPFDAFINVTAKYRAKANPRVLLDNVSSSSEIDVDLIARISGQLLNSDIDFDLQLPNANSAVNSELQFKLNDQDKKMTQFLSLLISNNFTNLDDGGIGIDAGSAGTSLLSEKISSVLSSLLKSRGDKFSVGVSYDVGDRNNINEALNTDDQLGLTYSTRLGKNITVNGKFGVPFGGNTQSRVVGEVELEMPLNKDGSFTVKAYNKQNEVELAAADREGYTQGVGLSYQVDFDNLKELKEKVFGKKKKKKLTKKEADSLKIKNDIIQFTTIKKDSIKPKKSAQKSN